MGLDCSLGLINASPTHADFQICVWPGSINAKRDAPLFGELANRLSMFLIRSDRAGPATIKPASLLCGGMVGAKKMIRAAHAKEKQ
jgi:hypothetical protein